MIRRSLAVGVLLVLALLVQTVVFARYPVLGFRPDLVVLVVLAVAVHDGPMTGARVGAAAGFLVDVLVTTAPVGLAVFVTAVVGYLAGTVRPYLAPGSLTAPVVLAFVTGAGTTGVYGALAAALSERSASPELLAQTALVVGLLNALFAPVVFPLVGRVTSWLPLREGSSEHAA